MAAVLAQLAALSFATCGLLTILHVKKWAARMALVGIVLAVGAGLAPRFIS